jgi:predicted nucleotide-binding protein
VSEHQHSGDNNVAAGNQSFGNSGNQTMGAHSPIHVPPPAGPVTGQEQPRQEPPQEPGRRTAVAPSPADRARSVFVVHGRDEEVRREMFALLRRLDLRPLEWEDLVKATGQTAPFLGEVVAGAPAQAQASLVLLTPDDIAKLHPQLLGENEPADETRLTGQPRQNVLIELGMVLMAYPERTVIVEVGALRHVADTAGRNVIRFDGSETALGKIVERLKQAGCPVNDTGSDWRQTWPYRHFAAYRRTA